MKAPLSGRRALVTGGTRGIGAAIALRLRQDGAEVIVTGAQSDGKTPEGCSHRAIDLSDRKAAETFAGEASSLDFDVLVNNAGINKIAPFSKIATVDYDRIQEVNVRGPFLLCRAVLPGMIARGWGRIINVTSVFGVLGKEHRAAYAASKFALDGLTACLAAEAASQGVLANCVAPGFIDTDLTRSILGEAGMAEIARAVPAKRLGRPEEIAAFVAWLCGPENTYISGQSLVIDGGFSRV